MYFSSQHVALSITLGMVFTYIFGNLLLFDQVAFFSSSKIVLMGIILVLSLISLDSITKRSDASLLIIALIILLSVRLQFYWLGLVFPVLALHGITQIQPVKLSRAHLLSNKTMFSAYNGLLCALIGLGTWSYVSFDMETLSRAGLIGKDTMFHTSLAVSLRDYSVASTMLNGLVPVDYHVFSHTIYAAISQWGRVSVLDSYGTATFIIFIPLLVASLVYGTLKAITQLFPEQDHKEDNRHFFMAWIGSTLLLFLTPVFLSSWGFWSRYFFSESFLISLTFFGFALPLLTKTVMSRKDALVFLGLLAFSAHTKGPVGLVLMSMACLRLPFLSKMKNGHFDWHMNAFLAVMSLVVTISIVAVYAKSASGSITFQLFQFPQSYGNLSSKWSGIEGTEFGKILMWLLSLLLFFMAHFWTSCLVLGIKWYQDSFKSLLTSPWFLMTGATMSGGILIFAFLNVNGSSQTYFTNISFFVVIPLIIAYTSKVLINNFDKITQHIKVLMISILVIVVFFGSKQFRLKSFYKRSHQLAKIVYPFPLAQSLIQIRDNDQPHALWRLEKGVSVADGNPRTDCSQQPLFFPAVSERLWLGLIPDRPECSKGFGYNHYQNPQVTDQLYKKYRAVFLPGIKQKTLPKQSKLSK